MWYALSLMAPFPNSAGHRFYAKRSCFSHRQNSPEHTGTTSGHRKHQETYLVYHEISQTISGTLRQSTIAMENEPFSSLIFL